MRALEQGERSRECGRTPEPGGSHFPIPCPANTQHPLFQRGNEPGQAVSPTPVGLEAKLVLVLLTW